LADGSYTFRNALPLHPPQGECIDLKSDNAGDPGQSVQHIDCRGGEWQTWIVKRQADGCYTIKQHSPERRVFGGVIPAKDRCLDVREQTVNDFGGVLQWNNCNGASNQSFKIEKSGDAFSIFSKRNGLCVDLRESERGSGGRVQMMACNGTQNQKWTK